MSVVVFRGSRHLARMVGSQAGPMVLAPGPSKGWQVLSTLPGGVFRDPVAWIFLGVPLFGHAATGVGLRHD